jgi:hypothetical protein
VPRGPDESAVLVPPLRVTVQLRTLEAFQKSLAESPGLRSLGSVIGTRRRGCRCR